MIKTFSITCLLTVVLCAIAFPEVIITGKTSFLMWNDRIVDYVQSFALTAFLYQGGLQLWDFFGQMPHTYSFMTFGMLKIENILTAAAYFVLSPFSLDSAQFFHRVHAFVNVVTVLLINAAGIFLVLKRLSANPYLLTIVTSVCAVFFTLFSFVSGQFFLNITPLAMYFVLSFFETFQWRYVFMCASLFIISLQQGIVHTFYTHLIINLFFLSCLSWALLFNRPAAKRWVKEIPSSKKKIIQGTIFFGILSVIIFGPYIYLQLFSLKDLELGLSASRLNNFFNVNHYFNSLTLTLADHQDFFRRMLDFTFAFGETAPSCSFFLGYMMFLLAFIGFFASANTKKWIFFAAIMLTWLINFPRDSFNIGTLAHWVNIITNPFKSMARTYEMASIGSVPYFIIPLSVLGMEVLLNAWKGRNMECIRRKTGIAVGAFVGFIALSMPHMPPVVKNYIIVSLLLSLTALAILFYARTSNLLGRYTAIGTFAALLLADMGFSALQTKNFLALYASVRPHQIGHSNSASFNYLDYQNPKIFPFVESFEFSNEADPLLWSVSDVAPAFMRMISMELPFTPHDPHRPRHAAYRTWGNDQFMKDYLKQHNQLFTFTRAGIADQPGLMQKIVKENLSRTVTAIDPSAPGLLDSLSGGIPPLPPIQERWVPQTALFKDFPQKFYAKDNFLVWEFPKASVPAHIATTAFTQDSWVRFAVQFPDKKTIEFTPAQGALTSPGTFDAQNIKEGKVYAALPLNASYMNGAIGILMIKNGYNWGIQSVWRHKHDETGITYKAPSNGWLVIHYPYDKKWRITVDGKITRFYRANNGFMAVPVSEGDHKILIKYWPNFLLRVWLVISAVISLFLFFAMILYSVKNRT